MNIKSYIKLDRMDYYPKFSKGFLVDFLLKTEQYWLRRFVKTLRKEEYYTFHNPNKILKYYYQRRKNILGRQLGFFIPAGCFGPGLKIYHYGSIIVNPKSKIGKNCTIHGNCCIGSKGILPDDSPIIGDNVDIGQGAQILGRITIADGVRIGAGSIVTKSVFEENVTIVGIPAKIISKNK
ncbi:serine acetyltransferase [Elizabethkingia anophelis]|uniref:serine O-acetyltransferase n=2 Tax=Elizabethkingia anophelis TaxID=1117645 RepID=UPI0004E2A8EE|nr:serine acetyltransferase [Elizabethkingia anophelis]KFC39650.1 serine acetyltransferase [Elizabethkingia anophelis]MCT3646317.1 serine acetyltransferase [Elizabethkingia anophelis]MCT3647403.1 serine acetyltransferase [Elizabethkingia anophelis]MCT3693926.1 serine acetyltransferase [Elizabethkingia anophelis]MCT3764187.1 serine acetyltransferase [Elizabethkingia anophelis]